MGHSMPYPSTPSHTPHTGSATSPSVVKTSHISSSSKLEKLLSMAGNAAMRNRFMIFGLCLNQVANSLTEPAMANVAPAVSFQHLKASLSMPELTWTRPRTSERILLLSLAVNFWAAVEKLVSVKGAENQLAASFPDRASARICANIA